MCFIVELLQSCRREKERKKKLTLRLSKVLTVCAKSLTLPGDAVPCPLGPEDTREPSMTSKPESRASAQLQWDSLALWPDIRYVFKPTVDKNHNQHRWKARGAEMQLGLVLCGWRTHSWKVEGRGNVSATVCDCALCFPDSLRNHLPSRCPVYFYVCSEEWPTACFTTGN